MSQYLGYEEKYDEWKNLTEEDGSEFPIVKLEQLVIPARAMLNERTLQFCTRMRLRIKRSLGASRKDCPEVRFELAIDLDIYKSLFQDIGVPASGPNGARQVEKTMTLLLFLVKVGLF